MENDLVTRTALINEIRLMIMRAEKAEALKTALRDR